MTTVWVLTWADSVKGVYETKELAVLRAQEMFTKRMREERDIADMRLREKLKDLRNKEVESEAERLRLQADILDLESQIRKPQPLPDTPSVYESCVGLSSYHIEIMCKGFITMSARPYEVETVTIEAEQEKVGE